MTWRYSEQWEIQRLKYIIIFSWDTGTRKKAVDTLASYRKKCNTYSSRYCFMDCMG